MRRYPPRLAASNYRRSTSAEIPVEPSPARCPARICGVASGGRSRCIIHGLNAGFQRRVALAADEATWSERQQGIDVLFAAPVHLNHLLVPLLVSQGRPTTVVNVTSGGAFVPQVFAPIYSASKAALHSYAQTLRHALAETGCRVVELVPPRVQTSLAPPAHGAPLEVFCDAAFAALINPAVTEFGFGPTAEIEQKSAAELRALFVQSTERAAVTRYGLSTPSLRRTDEPG